MASLGNTIFIMIIFSATLVFMGAVGFFGTTTVPNPNVIGPSTASVQELNEGIAGQSSTEFNLGSSIWMMFKSLGQGVAAVATLPATFGKYLAMMGVDPTIVVAFVALIAAPWGWKILSGLWTWISGRYL